jgi:hypothetical protein
MRNVGTIAVLNEPLAWGNKVASMLTEFYPAAYKVCTHGTTHLPRFLRPVFIPAEEGHERLRC